MLSFLIRISFNSSLIHRFAKILSLVSTRVDMLAFRIFRLGVLSNSLFHLLFIFT